MLEADAAYRRSLAISPNVADTYLQLGHLQKVQGDIAEAAESYAAALRPRPWWSTRRRSCAPSAVTKDRKNTR